MDDKTTKFNRFLLSLFLVFGGEGVGYTEPSNEQNIEHVHYIH